jgi:hypothetical protein
MKRKKVQQLHKEEDTYGIPKGQLNYIKSLKELWSKSCASATFSPYNHLLG